MNDRISIISNSLSAQSGSSVESIEGQIRAIETKVLKKETSVHDKLDANNHHIGNVEENLDKTN
jgi:hypothetical protein